MEATNAQPAPVTPLAPALPQVASDQLSYLDQQELINFLILLRDNYPLADLANLFLEENCQQTVNVAAVANLRDVLSHFATFLRAELTPEKRKEQITNAAEHLRRAVLEPYELTYRDNVNNFRPLLQRYIEELLPVKDEHAFLASAPLRHNIETRLTSLHEHAEKGRLAKGNNAWVPDWKAGVGYHLEAFRQLKELIREIESHWFKFQQVTNEKKRQQELSERLGEVGRVHQEELAKAISEVKKSHRQTIFLHWAGLILAVVFFLLDEYKFHVLDNVFRIVHSLWSALVNS